MPSVTGGPNPASNSKLADLIAKAKRMSVPNDNIQRIIKKAEGGDKTEYEAITYEGYGPGGVAVMVETLTDNRNRTAADLRHYFDKNGGNLGAMGCVGFLFSQKGVIDISLEDKDADEAMMDALDAGAEDFRRQRGRCRDHHRSRELLRCGQGSGGERLRDPER